MTHLPLAFNNNPAKQVLFQNHLGVYLYGRLEFVDHLQSMFKKAKKTIDLLRKLQNNISRAPLLTTFKWFIRLYLDYGDISYDQTASNYFHERFKSIQCN